MKNQTENYLNIGYEESLDFSQDICFWIQDNWDRKKTNEGLREEMLDFMFQKDGVSTYKNVARKQANKIFRDVRDMETKRLKTPRTWKGKQFELLKISGIYDKQWDVQVRHEGYVIELVIITENEGFDVIIARIGNIEVQKFGAGDLGMYKASDIVDINSREAIGSLLSKALDDVDIQTILKHALINTIEDYSKQLRQIMDLEKYK